MADPGQQVFLSYRREISWPLANAVRGALIGFDVFLDTQSLDSGEFERVILREIEKRAHFLVLLEPRSLDRIGEPGDWLRREIAHALAHHRNVVPLLANGARMPRVTDLPSDLARLPSFNAVSVPHDYFTAAMQKLRERFLRVPEPVPSAEPPASVGWLSRASLSAPTLSQSRTIHSPLVVSLVWTEVDGVNGYEVEQSPSADFAQGRRTDVVARTDHDVLRTDLDRDGRCFRVRAVAFPSLSRGPWSNTVEAS
jgi:TIR domain